MVAKAATRVSFIALPSGGTAAYGKTIYLPRPTETDLAGRDPSALGGKPLPQLVIQLSGEVLSSNFDEWKHELISRLQAVNTELRTDPQFVAAAEDVKRFKAAEQTLKQAKESAINQAADIQRLFDAIDEVSAEVRRVRLSLERQIKQRKLEIKQEYIESGLARIRNYIELQDADFRSIDHSPYLDRDSFVAATKGRTTVYGLDKAVETLCRRIKTQIDERREWVRMNASSLDSLPAGRRALFQDRGALLALAPAELNSVIEERIATYEAQLAARETDADHGQDRRWFDLVVELLATDADADALLAELRSAYANNPAVRRIRLDRK
jgi:hypothetical protein